MVDFTNYVHVRRRCGLLSKCSDDVSDAVNEAVDCAVQVRWRRAGHIKPRCLRGS